VQKPFARDLFWSVLDDLDADSIVLFLARAGGGRSAKMFSPAIVRVGLVRATGLLADRSP
jgi:hypothetical protein